MKKIIALMLALMTVFAFVSCGGDDEGEGADSQQKAYSYSVKIMAGTTPIVGAKVDLRNASADVKKLIETDVNGEAAYTSTTEISGAWVAKITSIPDVYGVAKDEYLGKEYTLTNGSVTVEFAQVELPKFEIKVVDQNGDAVAGVKIQLCSGEICNVPRDTNDAGVAEFDYAVGDYTAKIFSLPDGYSVDDMEAKYTFNADLECTITVTKN